MMPDNLCISLPLIGHPLLEANRTAKSEYVGVLLALTEHFSANDWWSTTAISEFARCLSVDAPTATAQSDLEKSIRRLTADSFSFQQFRFNNIRQCLICDILLLTAFNNLSAAQMVVEFLLPMLRKRHRSETVRLVDCLYSESGNSRKFISAQKLIEYWWRNLAFGELSQKRILVTATMSAGKSTFINAMVGKDILETRNEACTSSIHRVFSKPFADGIIGRFDNDVAVFTETFEGEGICFIDTPGVNSVLHPEHREITYREIKGGQYDVIAYVINARYSGVADDDMHLRFVLNNKPPEAPIVFVFNQLDAYNEDDSVGESVDRLRDWLCEREIQEPKICPVSAKAGRLAQKVNNGEVLNKFEERLFNAYTEDFETPAMDLSKYYGQTAEADELPLLRQCGLTGLKKTLINI